MADINQLRSQQLDMINEPLRDRQSEIDNARRWLKIISMIESSGGKNLNHPEIKSGIHAGDRAIGEYGLMPNTVEESLTRMKNLEDYPSEDLQKYKGMESDKMKKLMEANPQDSQRIAEFMAERSLKRMDGDPEKAAYGWFQGHNLTPEQIEERKYKEHDYVEKFNKFRRMFEDDNKSITNLDR